MCTRGLIVCKWRPCLPKGPTNSARMRTIVTAALQRQYLQTELILWIRLYILYAYVYTQYILTYIHTQIHNKFTLMCAITMNSETFLFIVYPFSIGHGFGFSLI
jgi:hypothetical protein